MDIRRIGYFIELADLLNCSRATQHLHISH